MISTTPSLSIPARQERSAKVIAAWGAAISALTAGFYDYLAVQNGAWQIYALSLDVWLLAVFLLISLFMISRGRVQTGIWVMLISAYISFSVAPLLLSGLGLILGTSLAILVTIIASIALTGQQAERAIFLGAVFSALTIFIDLFIPGNRLAAPELMQLGLSAFLIAAALIFGVNFVRQFQQFRVAARLSALILMISLPVVAAMAIIVTSRAGAVIEEQANEVLQQHNQIVNTALSTWLDLHGRALTELAGLPDITSMDPALQKPTLTAMAKAYPNLFLVQTTDLNGINIARSDDTALKDYHDRNWFLGAKSGAQITLEALISRTNGKPALNMAAPIKDASGKIIGVASIVSTLDEITKGVVAVNSDSGYVFVVDSKNNVIAHPDPSLTGGDSLHDFSNYPPVAAMRQGTKGIMDFTDENGTRWRAYIYLLDNGWGVISQEPINVLLAPLRLFQKIAVVIGMVGLAVLLSIAWLTIHRTLKPIENLTGTVEAVTAGDFTQMAEVTSQDEIGILGEAFNKMTFQIRELIGGLEQRVSERTAEIERRATLLRTAAEVASAATSIQDLNALLNQTVRLLSLRFGFYHAGIFLLDETGRFAVLRAANSEGGQRMLARGHRLEVGRVGIVGDVAQSGQARIALDVGADAVYFDNPDLPTTHSEMALPLRIKGQILGVLDIQSTEPLAFTQEDIETLQVVADQLAISIENARLLAESQAAVEATRRAFGEIAATAWKENFAAHGGIGFRTTGERGAVSQSDRDFWSAEARESATEAKITTAGQGDILYVPILVRGQTIGALKLTKPQDSKWTERETQAAETLADQLSGALESARLFDSAQRRAVKEKALSEITSKISASTNMRKVLQTAVEELGRAIPGSDVMIQFQTGSEIERLEK